MPRLDSTRNKKKEASKRKSQRNEMRDQEKKEESPPERGSNFSFLVPRRSLNMCGYFFSDTVVAMMATIMMVFDLDEGANI